jgi:amidase
MDELCTKTALELAGLIRAGETSSREVIEAHLARIVEVNDHLNAVVVTLGESARACADAADHGTDAERARPFHGVPFTTKENLDLLGTPTTNGVPAFANAMPPRTAPVVQRMITAGAIPIGRTNLPELALRLDTDNPLRGRTTNPWNAAITPGGSSGGEGAALATGMSPFGIGNDIGGSVRNPAYCCGITSLKPSLGRLPLVTSLEPLNSMATATLFSDGPMARSVADLREGLAAMAGRHLDDPQSVDVPLAGPIPNQRRAAIITHIPGFTLPAATVAAIEQAAAILAAAGWQVESVEVPELDRVNEVWGTILNAGFLANELEDLLQPSVYRYVSDMSEILSAPAMDFSTALDERRRLQRVWSSFFSKYPVAVGPTWTCLPWPINSDLEPQQGAQLLTDTIRFITPGNMLGLPSVALPMGVDNGLPTGVQVYADLYRDDLALAASEVIESGRGVFPTPIDPVR